MSNSVRYLSVQQQQSTIVQSTSNHYPQNRRHYQASPAPPMINLTPYTNQRVNTSTPKHYQYQTPIATPLPISYQSSAYFLDRVDLDNYSVDALKQVVDDLLMTMTDKGVKVKLSLPDENLFIDDVADPSQSWALKKSELLYFWRDQFYPNILVIVTRKRSRRNHHHHHQSSRPYSASVFRIRNLEASQNFLQKAQQFFAQLSSSSSTTNLFHSNGHIPSEKTSQTLPSKSRMKKTPLSIYDAPARSASIEPPVSTAIRLVTRAEFDPGKTAVLSEDIRPTIHSVQSRRTLSETTNTSNESHSTGSAKEVLSFTKKLNGHHDDDDDDKMTTVSNNLSGEYVAELLLELKELRQEIAALKIEKRRSPLMRSVSTSPLLNSFKQTKESSTSPSLQAMNFPLEVDAETQTDFRPPTTRRRTLLKKNKKTMIGTSNIATMNHNHSTSQNTFDHFQKSYSSSSVNTGSEMDESTQDSSSQLNDSSNDSTSTRITEDQPIILAAPPRPMLIRHSTLSYTKNFSNEEGTFSQAMPIMVEKETSQFLSNTLQSSSSLNSEFVRIPPPPIVLSANNAQFSTPFINPLPTPSATPVTEHIYENVPTLMQTLANQRQFYNSQMNNNSDDQQQQQLSSLNQSNGLSYLLPEQILSNSPPSKETNSAETIEPVQTQKPQIVSAGRHRSQPVFFANHLTNPLFNVDKQLLINTIANQFGVDLNSPQLPNLVTNQHLFVARKRTFANMVWQMTPDEETALCSSPISSTKGTIDIDAIENDSNNSTRPILKASKPFPSTGKRRSITWDNTIE